MDASDYTIESSFVQSVRAESITTKPRPVYWFLEL